MECIKDGCTEDALENSNYCEKHCREFYSARSSGRKSGIFRIIREGDDEVMRGESVSRKPVYKRGPDRGK